MFLNPVELESIPTRFDDVNSKLQDEISELNSKLISFLENFEENPGKNSVPELPLAKIINLTPPNMSSLAKKRLMKAHAYIS